MSRFFRQDNAFLRIMAVVFALIEPNIMAVVACLPVVTIGAPLTATHSVLWHMVRAVLYTHLTLPTIHTR